MTPTFFLRSCCRSRPDQLALVPDERRSTGGELRYFGGGAIVREATPAEIEVDPETAWHEAGHAVIGVGFGMIPTEVRAGTFGYVQWEGAAPDADADVVMSLAGDFAAGLLHRQEHRPYDAELAPWISMIREPAGGGCDRCLILRTLVARHGIASPDVKVLGDYRRLEERALSLLRLPRIRAAVRAVAAALADTGRLSGAAVLEIVGRHVEPGEFLEREIAHENS